MTTQLKRLESERFDLRNQINCLEEQHARAQTPKFKGRTIAQLKATRTKLQLVEAQIARAVAEVQHAQRLEVARAQAQEVDAFNRGQWEFSRIFRSVVMENISKNLYVKLVNETLNRQAGKEPKPLSLRAHLNKLLETLSDGKPSKTGVSDTRQD